VPAGGSESLSRTPFRVVLPDEPPRLTPEAARVLLRILLKAHDQLAAADRPARRRCRMTNFVIYHRVAVADQQDAKPSPDAQLARCLAYIESKGWAAVAEYVDDTQGAAA
jgi:hypothetical protein